MKPIKRLFAGMLLLIISIILKYLVTAIAMLINPIYYLVTLKWKTGIDTLGEWFYKVALSNDQTGNVIGGVIFKYLFTKNKVNFHPFGDEDDTVSYVLARNKYKGNLNLPGTMLGGLLDIIDSSGGGHLVKAISNKIGRDQEAVIRMNENKYFE